MNTTVKMTPGDLDLAPGPVMRQVPVHREGGGLTALEPKSLEEAMKFSEILSGSNIVPKDYQGKPGNILVAIQWGYEIGLPPLQAMQNIAVINGRPSIWGDAMLAIVQASGALEYIKEDVTDESAVCVLKRRGQAEISREFSVDDAKTAGLYNKQGPWQQYPKRMLQMRARGFALRDAFADVLRGVHIAEEARDMPDEDAMRDVTPEADKPKGGSKVDSAAGAVSKKRGKTQASDEQAGPTIKDVLKRIDDAETEAELVKVGSDAGKLAGGEREEARAAYSKKLANFRMPPSGDGAPTIAETIERDLKSVSGLDVEDVLGTYADQMGQIKTDDPATYQRLIDLADERAGAK